MSTQLDEIEHKVITNLKRISKIIQETQNELNQKIRSYKQDVDQIKIK